MPLSAKDRPLAELKGRALQTTGTQRAVEVSPFPVNTMRVFLSE